MITEYFIENYAVDTKRVYCMGSSMGGVTLTGVLKTHADLFATYLHLSSMWFSSFDNVISEHLPIYIKIGRNDHMVSQSVAVSTYEALRRAYLEQGVSNAEIERLVILDIRNDEYFYEQGICNYHFGAKATGNNRDIIKWTLSQRKYEKTGRDNAL
jgi:predicted peptidase